MNLNYPYKSEDSPTTAFKAEPRSCLPCEKGNGAVQRGPKQSSDRKLSCSFIPKQTPPAQSPKWVSATPSSPASISWPCFSPSPSWPSASGSPRRPTTPACSFSSGLSSQSASSSSSWPWRASSAHFGAFRGFCSSTWLPCSSLYSCWPALWCLSTRSPSMAQVTSPRAELSRSIASRTTRGGFGRGWRDHTGGTASRNVLARHQCVQS